MADYSRQQRLPGFGEQGQQKLSQAKVLVIGAGGLGCAVIPVLAGAGVGELTIVDHDVVEASNLHRQTLYKASDIGQYKAELAARYAQQLNPEVSAKAITRRLTAADLLEAIEAANIVAECTDDFSHKMRVNDAAVLLKTPVVFANAVKLEGQLQSFSGNPDEPCLRCLWQQLPGSAMTCDAHGVLGSVPAILGTLQANEVLYLLTGVGQGLQQKVLYFDAATYSQRLIRLRVDENCPLHSGAYSRDDFLAEHSAIEYAGSLSDAQQEGMVIVDIRDAAAQHANPLPTQHQALAASELLLENKPRQLHELLEENSVLLVCYKGRTSLSVATQLRSQGYAKVFSMRGGAKAH